MYYKISSTPFLDNVEDPPGKIFYIIPSPLMSHQVAAIVDSREDPSGEISYKVRWKGFTNKFDSWLPKHKMNCPELIAKFEAVLSKLTKKKDWVVRLSRNSTVG